MNKSTQTYIAIIVDGLGLLIVNLALQGNSVAAALMWFTSTAFILISSFLACYSLKNKTRNLFGTMPLYKGRDFVVSVGILQSCLWALSANLPLGITFAICVIYAHYQIVKYSNYYAE